MCSNELDRKFMKAQLSLNNLDREIQVVNKSNPRKSEPNEPSKSQQYTEVRGQI